MARSDINDYANGVLLDFLDSFHERLRDLLEAEFGSTWLQDGVARHLQAEYFERARKMLDSPMRTVDMGKRDDELFGVEHLGNIVLGNWKSVFAAKLGDRNRTQVYLGEIAELRHNVSHRRRRHFLQRRELARFAHTCAVLLRAIESSECPRFEQIAESLSAGATPWGAALGGSLPPQDEIVEEFVGRPDQLRRLNEWLAGDTPQLLVWGYGGAGKSALAYEFARETKEISPVALNAVTWVSAKKVEYADGKERPKRADFIDRSSVVRAIYAAMYESEPEDALTEAELLENLSELPILLIVDDFDTVLADDDLVEFLMHDVRSTGSRVLYTSRQKVAGLRSIEVLGFEGSELEGFIGLRAREHELEPEPYIRRAAGIHSVTGGFPLFVDDLLRYAKLAGLDDAVADWSQRKGDAAREYALRRQLEQLGPVTRDVLMALSVSDRPLTTLELSSLTGITDDDAELSVAGLLDWRLINRVPNVDEERPGFAMNLNTRRLVQRTYGSETRMSGFRTRYKALGGGKVSPARTAAVESALGVARSLVARGNAASAVERIRSRMTGELADAPELHGGLAFAYSRKPDKDVSEARRLFETAYSKGNTHEETYFYWATMERELAEDQVGRVSEERLLDQWRRCIRAVELGIRVAGPTRALSHLAGYAHGREGKTLEYLREFTQAQGAYAESVEHLRRSLSAPPSPVRNIHRDLSYRSLVLSLEGIGDLDALAAALREWAQGSAVSPPFEAEFKRLCARHIGLAALVGSLEVAPVRSVGKHLTC